MPTDGQGDPLPATVDGHPGEETPASALPEPAVRAEGLVYLHSANDQRRVERRVYEWKVSLGLWAGLLAALKIVTDASDSLAVTNITSLQRWTLCAAATALGLTVVGGHWIWLFAYTGKAHARDLSDARHYEKELCALLGVSDPPQHPAGEDEKALARSEKGFGTTARIFELGTTAFIYILAAAVMVTIVGFSGPRR